MVDPELISSDDGKQHQEATHLPNQHTRSSFRSIAPAQASSIETIQDSLLNHDYVPRNRETATALTAEDQQLMVSRAEAKAEDEDAKRGGRSRRTRRMKRRNKKDKDGMCGG